VRGEIVANAPHPADRLAVLKRMEAQLHKSASAFDEKRLLLEAERVRNLELALQAFCTVAYHGSGLGELRTHFDDGGYKPVHSGPGAEPLLHTLVRSAADLEQHGGRGRAQPKRNSLPSLHTVTMAVSPPPPATAPPRSGDRPIDTRAKTATGGTHADGAKTSKRLGSKPSAETEPIRRAEAPLIPLPRLLPVTTPERPAYYG
jgi:hypothetical protein